MIHKINITFADTDAEVDPDGLNICIECGALAEYRSDWSGWGFCLKHAQEEDDWDSRDEMERRQDYLADQADNYRKYGRDA